MTTNINDLADALNTIEEFTLRKELNETQVELLRTVLTVGIVLFQKNTDYGSSVMNPPILLPDCPAGDAIMVRMSDKIQRIIHLLNNNERNLTDEPLIDSFYDLAGYSILEIVRRRLEEQKNDQEKGAEKEDDKLV